MVRLLVFVVLIALVALIVMKLVKGMSRAASRGDEARGDEAPQDAKLVRCASCGAYVPRMDALPAPDGFRCSDPKCRGGA